MTTTILITAVPQIRPLAEIVHYEGLYLLPLLIYSLLLDEPHKPVQRPDSEDNPDTRRECLETSEHRGSYGRP